MQDCEEGGVSTRAMVMGYAIQPHAKRLVADAPAHVALHRMGGEAPTYFTSEEARRFGEAMIAAAHAAENAR